MNRFQVLHFEGISDLDELESLTPSENTSATFELEEEAEAGEMGMAIFCFFDDCHRIRDFLHGVWKRIDLVTRI